MKKSNKIIYWISTALLSFGMLGSGIAQITKQPEMVTLITHVGFPMYFMTLIGYWKVIGVIVLWMPKLTLIKEWAYAGFFFLMTGALIAHLALGDEGKELMGPFFQTIFIVLSWYFRPDDRKIATGSILN